MNTFANRLKMLRTSAKRTQQDIADLLKVRRSTVGEYERGIIIPPADKINVLAKYFNVTVDYLIGNDDENEDLSKAFEHLLSLLNGQDLVYKGEPITEDERQLILMNLKNSIDMTSAILKNKK